MFPAWSPNVPKINSFSLLTRNTRVNILALSSVDDVALHIPGVESEDSMNEETREGNIILVQLIQQ